MTSSGSHSRKQHMKPTVIRILILTAVFATLAAGSKSICAQVLEKVNDYYLIEAQYDKAQAVPGSRNLYLKITMKVPVAKPVPSDQVLKLATEYEPLEDSEIKLSFDAKEPKRLKDGFEEEIYTFQIKIPEGTEPRVYKIKLKFQYPDKDKTTVPRQIDLNVGLPSKGKLKIIEIGSEPLIAGSEGLYTLKLRNEYPDYPINIHKLTLSSTPSGLISKIEVLDVGDSKAEINGNTVNFKPPLTIKPYQQPSIQLKIKARNMSIGNWISGFGEGSKLVFDFEYDDSNLRTISDFSHEAPVKVRPGDWTLLGAMFVGVLIGTGLKFYLEYLREKGVIRRKGVGIFVTITVLVGIVITIIAWAGQIQIIAFKDINFSYDRPVVIFIIGLIGALGGVHYLNNWAKKLLPQETGGEKGAKDG